MPVIPDSELPDDLGLLAHGNHRLDHASAIALAYLALPVIIFFLGWFELLFAMMMSALSAYGLMHALKVCHHLWRTPAGHGRLVQIGILAMVAAGWATFGGAGHFFYANFDWITRDAVLHDLVTATWPVSYGSDGIFEQILRAPIAYYLPAAAVAKLLGLGAANWLLWLWTVTGITIFFCLLPLPKSSGRITLLLAVVILFSGMDIAGWFLQRGSLPAAGQHIEWWAKAFQYSSNSTQLFWVPNHALPGWIAIALFYRHWRHPDFLKFAPMLLAVLPLWSPFAAIGMAPFYLLLSGRALRDNDFLRIANLMPAIGILAISGRYLTLDLFSVPAQSLLTESRIPLGFIIHYTIFVLLEFGLLGLLLWRKQDNLPMTVAIATLLLLPTLRMGPGNDIVMRGGIPALMYLSIASIAILGNTRRLDARTTLLLILLGIGAATPIQEFIRAIDTAPWQFNSTANLIDASNGVAPPHYVARLNQPGLTWLMKAPERIVATDRQGVR